MTVSSARWLAGAVAALVSLGAPAGNVLQECAQTTSERTDLLACLDARLKEANKSLNAALKEAQQKIEKLEKENRRSVQRAFVDSQRKFNAFRDADCSWQSVRVQAGGAVLEYEKDCQIRATLDREAALRAFVESGSEESAAPAQAAGEPSPPAAEQATQSAAVAMEPPVAAPQPPPQVPIRREVPPAGATTAQHGVEWHLVKWIVDGAQRSLVPDSKVTIAFDPTGKVSGNASVNRFSGPFRFGADGGLEWPPVGFALTRTTGPSALMAQERVFVEALRKTARYKVDGEELVLESTDGLVELTFAR